MSGNTTATAILAVNALTQERGGIHRTHIHKFLFLAERWLATPSRHAFSIYTHGPYSRDLDGELKSLLAVGILEGEADSGGFGATYSVTTDRAVEQAEETESWSPDQREAFLGLASEVADRGTRELEAISTTEFFIRDSPDVSANETVAAVMTIKPHLTEDELHDARHVLDDWRSRYKIGN